MDVETKPKIQDEKQKDKIVLELEKIELEIKSIREGSMESINLGRTCSC